MWPNPQKTANLAIYWIDPQWKTFFCPVFAVNYLPWTGAFNIFKSKAKYYLSKYISVFCTNNTDFFGQASKQNHPYFCFIVVIGKQMLITLFCHLKHFSIIQQN